MGWSTFIKRNGAKFSGDAIADLRTQQNTLSVWFYDSEVEENDAIVALCLNRLSLDKFVYISFKEEELDSHGIAYMKVPGKSNDVAESSILEQHRDLIELDYIQLGEIAELIHNKVSTKNCKTLTKKQVATLIAKAIDDSKVLYNNTNRVIVESYDLLKREKPENDPIPQEEIITKQKDKINELAEIIASLEEGQKDKINELTETINSLEKKQNEQNTIIADLTELSSKVKSTSIVERIKFSIKVITNQFNK